MPFVTAERDALERLGHELIPITVRAMPPRELDRVLADLDAVYVASGSTFALLEALQTTGGGAVVSERVRNGLPYIGASAGSIVAGPDATPASLMDDPADGPTLTSFDALGLVDHVVIPHADGLLPPYPRELIERTLETYGAEYALLPLRDDQAFLTQSGWGRVVDSEPLPRG
ncbi:Type 1 glutamine amidotransferase-like domain-containing protein [Microbacterium sediminicola]|uniref:Type 1 glutamine amidotransferase-like domain-containing protein n=1 Tax=Microbacterium sediminicola TaxID=415210 RepID=A0ABN2ID61_9MICO